MHVNIYTDAHVSSRPIVHEAERKKGGDGMTHIWKHRKAILRASTSGNKHGSSAVLRTSPFAGAAAELGCAIRRDGHVDEPLHLFTASW